MKPAESNTFASTNRDTNPSNDLYDPDDYLYKFFYDTLLHDEICFTCEYRKAYHCTAPNRTCNYVPKDNI